MCTSLILKPIFIIVIIIAIGLTAASLFSPGWRSIKNGQDINMGLFSKSCGSNNSSFDGDACQSYWNSRPTWEKWVIALMFVALILELVVLVWSVFSCFCFCLPSCFSLVTLIAAVSTVCLIVAVSLYGGKNSEQIGSIPNSTSDWKTESNVGYSFWLAVAAAGTMCLATLIGSVTSLISTLTPF
ncbi:hypothetical protein M3Y98_00591100 [Aphelenchoides besseyi]|nr:hypothetical protein M3Y98_00591100 [Aphelenchoides besseyi]KAI6193976.1 hypothetical protein M3Y96_01076000 [Aphelenchoides besseyi]